MPEFDPPSDSSPSFGMGTNDLQTHIDSLTTAVENLTTAVQGASGSPGGTTTSPFMSSQSEGQTFTSNVGMSATKAAFSSSGSGSGSGTGSSSGASSSGSSGGSGGTLNSMASGGGANAGGSSFSLSGVAAGVISNSSSKLGTMLTMNALGTQMQNEYGQSAQTAQNMAYGFGSNYGIFNSQGTADATSAYSTINQMASGEVNSSKFTQGVAATNMAVAGNVGMSASQGASFASQLYSGATSMGLMRLGLPTALQAGTGKPLTMGQFTSTLLPRLGIAAGKNGTFNQQQIEALGTVGSAQNTSLSMAGFSQSMIQDYAGIVGTANEAAQSKYGVSHKMTDTSVMNLMSQTGSSNKNTRDQAWSQLQDMGVKQSSINTLQQLNQQQMANNNSESGGYNAVLQKGVSLLTDIDNKLGKLLGGPLGSVLGGVGGAGAVAGIGGGLVGGTMLGSIAKNTGGIGSLLGKGLSLGKGLLGKIPGLGSLFGDGAAEAGADAAGGIAGAEGLGALGGPIGMALATAGIGGFEAWQHRSGIANLAKGAWNGISGLLGFATGGVVPGMTPGADTHTIRVSGGEGILTPEATMGIGGSSMINFLNQKYAGSRGGGSNSSQTHFATGGTVSSSSSKTSTSTSTSASSAGAAIEQKMLSFMLSKVGLPYSENVNLRLGPTAYDCSGLLYEAAINAGVDIPQSDDIANLEADWFGTYKGVQTIKSQGSLKSGDIIFMTGAAPRSSNYGPIGHAGMALSNTQMVSAYDTQMGVAKTPIGGFVVGFRLGAGTVTANGSVSNAGTSGSASNAASASTVGSAGGGGAAGVAAAGNGGDSNLGLTTDADASLFGGAGAGVLPTSGAVAASSSSSSTSSTSSSSSTSTATATAAAATGVTAGSTMANGKTIYDYLLTNLFGGNKIAAAGAIASMYGESTWNPEITQAGGPGMGIMQWTSGDGYTNGIITGNASADLAKQLPDIINFVKGSGDMGTISAMEKATTVSAAAQLWDQGVERAGIDDVTAEGISLATQIAGLATGGTFIAGERGPELVSISNGQSANVMNAQQTQSLLSGTSAQMQSTTSAAQLLYDTMTTANMSNGVSTGSSGGVNVTFAQGSINLSGTGTGTSAGQFTGTLNPGSDVDTYTQAFQKAVMTAFNQSQLLQAVRSGDTGS